MTDINFGKGNVKITASDPNLSARTTVQECQYQHLLACIEGFNSFPEAYNFYHFTLANARQFYSSRGEILSLKELSPGLLISQNKNLRWNKDMKTIEAQKFIQLFG